MSKRVFGVVGPLIAAAATCAIVFLIAMPASIAHGIQIGVIIALLQSLASTIAMDRAWNTKWFYWVWGGGMFFRGFVLLLTGLVVYRFSSLNLAATLLSAIVATTIFLTLESAVFFKKK